MASALTSAFVSGSGAVWAPGAAADAPAVSCVQDWRPASSPTYLTPTGAPTNPPAPLAAAPSAAHRPFHLFCGARYVTTLWLSPTVNEAEGERVAFEIAHRIPFPDVHLAVNPQRGITGLASWFWATPDASSVRLLIGNGPNMEFDVRVARLRWTFAEADSPTDTALGFGSPFPTPSAVQHMYERKGHYMVRADVVFSGRYWIDQRPHTVPDTTRTMTLRHDVAEIRSLLHAR